MASESGVRTTLRTLREANSSPDSKAWALTSLRRSHLENQKVIKTLSDEEFCELCNSIIELGIRESVSDKLHTEACRTLDTILPESQNKQFDFFQSILQINRKKRLKILVSLSILKDETVAIVASKLSILEFFNDCLVSVQPKTMIWLQPEFANNAELVKSIDTRVLNETEEFEEKVIERSLQLLHRLCELSSVGLSIQQFDTFIMDKIVLLSYMGTSKQRTTALAILHSAAKNDLGTRVRSFHKDIWDKYKLTLQNIYCKRMTLLVNLANLDWSRQWETSIILIGTDLHRGSALVNSLLKVEELAFKSADPIRRQAFLSWKLLIDNFALDPRELATARRIKLLCVPLNAKNSKNELMILTKMEVWWHLIYKVYSSITECIDSVLIPYLTLCFGPLGDQPLFSQNKDSSVVALGKRFLQTQIFSIGTFIQLIVSKDDRSNISVSIDLETLPHPVSNSVFEKVYKIFIHCFGESIITLGSLSKDSIKNKSDICKIMWINLINRIEEYDKMKVPMYKEVLNVISELIKNQFHEIPLIKDFLLNVVLKSFNKIVKSVPVPESILLDLTFAILRVNNFSCMTNDHNQHIESLLWHVIKPSNADVYYPQTLELMQKILKIIDEASKTNSYMSQTCEIWCILAKIAKKYIADYQNINEGNLIKYNFKTIESIINFPFTNLVTNDFTQIKNMTEIWCSLYKQFDFQTELIVTVKPHEILERVSKTIIASLHNDKMSCDFAAVCIDGLLDVVNYDNLPSDKEVPQFVHLLKNLTIQCIESKSYATDKSLKALSSFLLCVFSHSPEKTILYLKVVEPAIKCMITKLNDNSLERDLLNMWTTIVGLFKKLKKSLTYDLLNCYSQTIALAAKNRETCAATYSILDIKDNVDEKSKKLLEGLSKEFDQSSILNDSGRMEPKEKFKKRAPTPIGSFLNRKSPSSSVTLVQNGKENVGKASKIVNVEPDSQDFVVINTDIKLDVNRLTEHQKERLKKRRDDIPAMYNELSLSNSQDSQQLQHWFNVKSSKSAQKKGAALNKNESAKKSDPQLSAHKIICETQEQQATTSSQSESEKPITASSGSAGKLSPKVAAPAAAAEQENNRAINAALAKDAAATAAAADDDVAEQAPNVAKRLNFEAEPAESEPEEETQRSPSLESGMRMRRKSDAEEQDKPGVAQQKGAQSTRRSLQQQPGRGCLRKFNSADDVEKSRARKRRNSDSNSESMLSIERVKRPRITESMEVLNSCDSEKSPEDGNTQNSPGQVEPTTNLSKRQLSEITRLKINMRFEPLPNRRSVCKSGDAEKKPAGSRDERSKEEKTSSSAGKAKEDRVVSPTKRESRNVASAHKLADGNSQQFQSVITTRRSLKGFAASRAEANEQKQQETGAHGRKEAAARRSVAPADNAGQVGRSTARKSLPGKFESNSFKKKADSHTQESTQEAVDIEDVTTQADNSDKLEKNNDKRSESQDDDATMMEEKTSQDPDIVESSQEPSLKFDKAECFIKIKKVELFQNSSFLQQVPEKVEKSNAHEKIIEETQMDTEDKSVSLIQATIESDRPVQAQTETKKGENKVTGNQNLSPKSSHPRVFKPKTFSLTGRAAQMIGLVTKQSMSEKFGNSESTKVDFNLTDEVTIVPLKKDKVVKESDRVASPISSRQEKMFNNMNNLNNLKQQDRCSSPAIMMFCNLKNDGERISPKLERHQLEKESEKEEKESSSTEMSDTSDDSPKKKELPMLEWSNANPPSLTASPSVSILKRMQEFEFETPNSRKKRVSFADPPVSREMGYVIMTETSSPPRLEKLPTVRSPTSRKDSRKDLRKDLRIQRRRIERENDLNSGDDKLTNNETGDETSISNEVSVSLSPKVRLATILTKVPEEPKTTEAEATPVSQTQDMFEDTSVSTNETVPVKTSTQNDANNSSIKIDSFNLSNILQRSDKNQSLEDTVDINNLSSSLENTHNTSDKTSSTCSTCSTSCKEPADTLPVTDSVFSNPALTQESQNNVAQLNKPEILDSTLPIYPSLTSCSDAIDSIRADLVEPTFAESLAKHFSLKSIRSVGDLAQLTEREISRLPIVGVSKVETVKKALSRYEKNLTKRTPKKKMKPSSGVSSSTPLGNRRRDKNKLENEFFNEFESESVNNSYENKRRFSKRSLADTSMQTSPIKRLKKDDEKTFAELMTQCDEDFVMNQFVKKFNFEKVLQSYNMQSSELLKILVKNLIQEKEKKSNLQIFNEADLQILLNEVPANSILEQIKIRKDLNSSEALLNICLENGVNKLSNDAKRKTLKNFAEKIDTSDLFDVCVEILKTLKLKTC